MYSSNSDNFIRIFLVRLIPVILIGFGLVACGESKDVQTLIKEAREYQQKGDSKAAVIQLKNALQQESNNKEARYLLGTIYDNTGDFLAAEKELNRALSLGMDAEKVMPILGKTLFRLGEFQQLLDKTEGLANNNASDEIMLLRGDAFLAVARNPEAKNIFEQILARIPNSPDALLGLARHALSERDLDSAVSFSDTAVASNPENVDVRLFKADLLRAQGKNDEALTAYAQVIQLKPDNVSAHISKATIEIGLRNLDNARASIDAARKVAPGALMVNYTQALLDFSQGNHTAALDTIQQVLSVAPEHLPSVLLAGATQLVLGSLPQAEQYLDLYLKKIPGNLYARKLMINVQLRNKQSQEAITLLVPLLKEIQKDPQLYALAGEAYMQARDFTKATEYFEKANDLAPNNAELHTALGMSKLAMGDSMHGIAELQQAANMDSKSPRAGILLALTHLRLKEFDKALTAVNALEKTDPKNPLFHNLKGGVYLNKKDTANARTSFNKALSLDASYFPAIANLAQMDVREKKPEIAKKRFEAVLKTDEKNIQAMNALASLAQSQGDVKETTAWLELASNKNPAELQPALQLIAYYLRIGEKEKSLMHARKLYGANPNEPRVLEILGQAQLANDNKAAALESYEKLAVNQPRSAAVQLQIASIHAAMQNLTASATALKKALTLQPDYLDAQVAQFRLAVLNKNEIEALSISQEIQKIHQKSPIGHVLEGDVLMAQKKPDLALKQYEKAFSIEPSGPLAIKVHATLNQLGNEKQASAKIAKWLSDHPDDFVSRIYLAGVHLSKKQHDAAIKEYEAILKKHPEHTPSLNNLAWLYQQKKDARALEYAEKAYKQAPEAPAILDTLGWILTERGDTARAIPLLQKAVSLATGNAEIQYHFAAALEKSGDKARARTVLETLLATDKAFSKQEEAKALLKKIQ